MQVTLFIGHHKTGSTALQDYLSRNHLRLLRHGVLYPMVESEGLTFALSTALRRKLPVAKLPINMREAHNALAFQMIADHVPGRAVPELHRNLPHSQQMFVALRNQIDILKPKHVILCSEVMSNFAVWPRLIDQLAAQFSGLDLRIICTLRRPDDYLMSWHTQRLRFKGQMRSFRQGVFKHYQKSIHFDYQRMLSAWHERLPDATLMVRPYSEVMEAGGSIKDFRERSGIRFPRGLLPPLRSNPSLPYATAEILRRGYHVLQTREDRAALLSFVEKQARGMDLPKNSEIEMLGAPLRAQMQTEFAPIHDYLNTLTGRSAFFTDIDQMSQTRPVSEQEAMQQTLQKLRTDSLEADSPVRAFLEDLRQSETAA